jgi:AcrR family transcriptional regulator
MSKQTFHNLSDEKRNRFLAAAFREFAMNDYNDASVSRIVASLAIAKGSVYQYFIDKPDLYFHLLEVASQEKLAYLRERARITSDSATFFEIQRSVVLAGAEFDFSHPTYTLILLNAMRELPSPELGHVAEERARQNTDFIRDFVERGVAAGEIRADMDTMLLANVVNAVTLALRPYMERKYSFSFRDQLENPEKPLPFSGAELEREVDSLLDLLRYGISASQ